jgi:hypothetical protein
VRIFFINPLPACRETEKGGKGERDTGTTMKGCHQARIARLIFWIRQVFTIRQVFSIRLIFWMRQVFTIRHALFFGAYIFVYFSAFLLNMRQ